MTLDTHKFNASRLPIGGAVASLVFVTWKDTSSIMDETRMNRDECDAEGKHSSKEF